MYLLLVLVSFVTSAVTSGSYFCGTGFSSRREFKCIQGTDCVEKENVCDGNKDCEDGSDEADCTSKQQPPCILPEYPAHGTYEIVSGLRDGVPGQKAQSFILRVSCARGYGMMELANNENYNGTQEVLCVNAVWSQNIHKCVRFCKLKPDPSVRYMCAGTVCKNYVPPGTSVNPICNTHYYSENLLYMKCKSGTWNYIASCKADCGRLTPKGVQLVIDGISAKRGELPWHVGIYRKTEKDGDGRYSQICGGSLVARRVVISAAHCFWSDVLKLLPATNYAVAIGKLYRSWDDDRDVDAQKSDVEEIRIPALFQGTAAYFQEDIAVLILVTPFTFNAYVSPVCLNFYITFDILQLQHGNLGKVAGWGLTAANGAPSDILKTVEMPFISEGTCVNTLPQSFRPFITGDKFCAGYTNGTALCKGDSGGGIVFSEREQGVDRYYLRGIVSTAPNVDLQLCNDKTYTTFTRIRRHEEIIKSALVDANAVKSCPSGMIQCDDDTCQDEEANCS